MFPRKSRKLSFVYKYVYKYDFTEEPDSSLQCVVCLEIAEDPWQHSKCGRLLCRECLEKYGRDMPCPNCRRKWPQYFEDNRSMREIRALPITCNVNKECEWEGTLGSLDEHLGTCDFVLVPCPKQCTEADSKVADFMRKDVDEHLKNHCPNRAHKCSDCGEKGTYANITQDHDMVCAKKPLPCPNSGCGDIVERQQVPKHVSKCPHTVIPCKYKGIGCDAELERKDMAAHEQDDKLHLHMALDTVTSQQDAIKQQQLAIYMLQASTKLQQGAINSDAVKSLQPATFALPDYQKKKERNELFNAQVFYTSPNGYCVEVMVFANGYGEAKDTHVSIAAAVPTTTIPKQQGNVIFTLMNQLVDTNHHRVVTPLKKVATDQIGAGTADFICHSALAHDPVKNTQYLKDDTLYFRVEVQLDDYKPWLECTIGVKH